MFRISVSCIGPIMAFGAGVLIRAVAFDLVEEAPKTAPANWPIYLACSPAAASSSAGYWLIDRSGRSQRKDPTGAQQDGPALTIGLGSVFDGIPESMVVGLTIYQGAASAPTCPSRSPRVTGGWSAHVPATWHLSMLLALMHAPSGELRAGRVADVDAEPALVDTILGAVRGAGDDGARLGRLVRRRRRPGGPPRGRRSPRAAAASGSAPSFSVAATASVRPR